jgi:general stress protein 26
MNETILCDFINHHRYGVISSIADDSTPQSAVVGIAATPTLDIVFDTLDTSRKFSNLRQRPSCSFVIGCSGEQTLQIEGHAEILEGEARDPYLQTYFAQWPEGRDRLQWPGIAYLVVHPTWLRYSDFSQNPPIIHETVPRQFRQIHL